MPNKTVHIGCAAGFADERPDAGIALVDTLRRASGPRYLIYETLGERTLALAQLERRREPTAGYTPQMESFLRPVLRDCRDAGIRIVANFGAANPMSAGRRAIELMNELGVERPKVAVVHGDDLLAYIDQRVLRSWEIVEGIPLGDDDLIAANVYLGAAPIVESLAQGADLVILGRCADSALTLGPLMHEFGWRWDDWDRLAAGTLAGHLLECSAHVTGGYFADPGYKDVPSLETVGYPIAEVTADGNIVVTKADATGGLVSTRTVKEQMLYELHDPSAYLVPDVVLDIGHVEVQQLAPNRVQVTGARGHPRPPTLKVTLSTDGGWLGEGEITYAGPNAYARATLAAHILRHRLTIVGVDCPTRIDLIGALSAFDSDDSAIRAHLTFPADGEYRVRLSGKSRDRAQVDRVVNELIGLYSAGPAGGGGVRRSVVSRVSTCSALVPRDIVNVVVTMLT